MSYRSAFKYVKSFRITPELLLTGYSANTQVCDPFLITGIVLPPNMSAIFRNITVVDFQKNESTLDFIFFNEDVTITNGRNQVVNASVHDVQAHMTSIERIIPTDYVSNAFGNTASVASIHPLNAGISANSAGMVKCCVITRKAFTPNNIDDLTFIFDFVVE